MPFNPEEWMKAAETDASIELKKLDAANAAKGGKIIAMVKAAHAASKADDNAPIEEQIIAAKKLGEQFDVMIANLTGQQRPSEDRARGRRKEETPPANPQQGSTDNPKPDKPGFFSWLFGEPTN